LDKVGPVYAFSAKEGYSDRAMSRRVTASRAEVNSHLGERDVAVGGRALKQRDLSVFYLLGGIGFLATAVILFVTGPKSGMDSVLGIGGELVAGVCLIVAYFGMRRARRG
jgi:hypothetical protein